MRVSTVAAKVASWTMGWCSRRVASRCGQLAAASQALTASRSWAGIGVVAQAGRPPGGGWICSTVSVVGFGGVGFGGCLLDFGAGLVVVMV
jgi:hypothetical protein